MPIIFDKEGILARLASLDDSHWDKVREAVAKENKEFEDHAKAIRCSPEKLKQEFDL